MARLDEGLDWLMHWDARRAKQALTCPVLALAARDDPIVPPAMSEAMTTPISPVTACWTGCLRSTR